jgi:hypothetical protein
MRSDQYVNAVLDKCTNLQDCGLWAAEPKVRPKAWLSNFTPEERPVAATLLDHFIFYSGQTVDALLAAGFRALRDSAARQHGASFRTVIENQAIFTAVEGEQPNSTDSGHLFCRKLRQIFALPDARFVSAEEAVQKAAQGIPVIFLDDFIGSGDQFVATWKRRYRPAPIHSFADAYAKSRFAAMYLSLVSTATGRRNVEKNAPMVRLELIHVLSPTFGVSAIPRNALTPDIDNIPDKISELLDKYSSRLIVPPYLSEPRLRKHGYDELGLQLAFDHSTPDATLPIFWAESGHGWTPLVRRS